MAPSPVISATLTLRSSFRERVAASAGGDGRPSGLAGHEGLELIGNRLAVEDSVEELHLVLHDAVEPQRGLLAGMAVLDAPSISVEW